MASTTASNGEVKRGSVNGDGGGSGGGGSGDVAVTVHSPSTRSRSTSRARSKSRHQRFVRVPKHVAAKVGHRHARFPKGFSRRVMTTGRFVRNATKLAVKSVNRARRGFWNRPIIVVDWNQAQEERKATWFELFYDLVFVAAAINLGAYIKSDLTIAGVTVALCLFAIMWQVWFQMTLYSSRFFANDAAHRIPMFLQCAGALGMAAHIGPASSMDGYKLGFIVAFLITRVTSAVQQVEVALVGTPRPERARRMTKVAVAIWLLTATFYVLAAALLPFRWAVAAWLALVVVETLVVVGQNLRGTKFDRLPVHVEHMAERFGLWVMLVLGESMISMVTTELVTDAAHYGLMALGLLLVFFVQHTYFDSQASHVNEHALRRTLWNGIMFVHVHVLASAAVLGTGVGIKLGLKAAQYAYLKPSYSWLLCGSVALTFASIYVIRYQHASGFASTLGAGGAERWYAWPVRVVVVLTMLLVPIGAMQHTMNALHTFLIMCLQSFVLVLNDTLSRTMRRSLEPEHHEQHEQHGAQHGGGGEHEGAGKKAATEEKPRKRVVPDYLKVYGEALGAAYGNLATAAPRVAPAEEGGEAEEDEYEEGDLSGDAGDDDDGYVDTENDSVGTDAVAIDVHSMAEELAALRSRVAELEVNAPRGYLETLDRCRGRSVSGQAPPLVQRARGASVAAGAGAGASIGDGEGGGGIIGDEDVEVVDEFEDSPAIALTQPVM